MKLTHGYSFGGHLSQLFPNDFTVSHQLHSFNDDEFWMLEALREATSGIGITSPNPAVGCVIVGSDGKEVSRGHTQVYRKEHAERMAFKKAPLAALDGATVYTTLEPCCHQGHQPPCLDLFLEAPIKRVVIACQDPFHLVNGQSIQKLKNAGKSVTLGVLNRELTAWHFPFLASQRSQRPTIILKWAQTLDGQLADDTNTSKWISGPKARAYTHWLRQKYDAILVGANTLLTDFPRLTVRDCKPPHQHQPTPIIFDPRGACFKTTPQQEKFLHEFAESTDKLLIITSEKNFNTLNNSKIHVFPILRQNFISEIVALLQSQEAEALFGKKFQTLFVEGGPKTLSLFLKSGYVDLIHTFISPKFTGGSSNRIYLNETLKTAAAFKPISSFMLDDDLVVEMISPYCEKLFRSQS